MTPAMPTSALLGALLLARAARDAGALKPVGDAAGDEAPALEKEEWPWRSARKEVGQLLSKMTDSSVHGFGQSMETDDDLDLHDGLPPAAGCYMRMPSGCPKQPMRTQAWRRDKMATERDLDEEGCHQRKQVWERYCGSEDAEMLYVSGQASSGPGELSAVSAPQVDVSALQGDVVWWPWGKKHESTKHESTTHESGSDEEVPLGEVVITHAGAFKDEYLYTTRDDDSHGGRVHAWMNGSLLHDPHARWNISKVGGNSTAYFITQAGSSKEEYLRASKNDDSRGGRVVHTWIHAANGSMMKDPWARWSISKVGGNYVIAPAVSKDEYLCATQNEDSRGGGRFVHTATGGLPADDPKAWWAVLPVAAAVAVASSGPGELSAVSPPQVDVSALQGDVVWWPWGKKHESTKHDEEVPLGEVVITHAGAFKDEYLYTTRDDDSHGGRVHAWMNGSLLHDPQARWNISKVGGNSSAYFITHAGSFKEEYLRASKNDDSRGGLFVHTANGSIGSMLKDPQARWSISKVGGNYVIAPAVSKDEYLCATHNEESRGGWRVVHTATGGSPADDTKAWWAILPVAGTRVSADTDLPVGNPTHPGCYMRMPSGCPRRPMRTQVWRLDPWAEEHELDQAGCEERKSVWNRYCEADDAKVLFVPRPPKQ